MIRKTNWRSGLIAIVALVPLAFVGGCSNGLQGAFSGAALGSLAGLGIGSVTGDRSDAVTMGAILGGVGGAIIGDQNARASAYSVGGGGSYGHTTERIVERPVYTDRTVYVERPVYVQPSPVIIYKSGGSYGHHSGHYSGGHSWRHSPRHYGHSRHRGSAYHCW